MFDGNKPWQFVQEVCEVNIIVCNEHLPSLGEFTCRCDLVLIDDFTVFGTTRHDECRLVKT